MLMEKFKAQKCWHLIDLQMLTLISVIPIRRFFFSLTPFIWAMAKCLPTGQTLQRPSCKMRCHRSSDWRRGWWITSLRPDFWVYKSGTVGKFWGTPSLECTEEQRGFLRSSHSGTCCIKWIYSLGAFRLEKLGLWDHRNDPSWVCFSFENTVATMCHFSYLIQDY